jgi:hypothetical protein
LPVPSLAAVLDMCTDDTLLAIAISLTTATDPLRLVPTSRAGNASTSQRRATLVATTTPVRCDECMGHIRVASSSRHCWCINT